MSSSLAISRCCHVKPRRPWPSLSVSLAKCTDNRGEESRILISTSKSEWSFASSSRQSRVSSVWNCSWCEAVDTWAPGGSWAPDPPVKDSGRASAETIKLRMIGCSASWCTASSAVNLKSNIAQALGPFHSHFYVISRVLRSRWGLPSAPRGTNGLWRQDQFLGTTTRKGFPFRLSPRSGPLLPAVAATDCCGSDHILPGIRAISR